MRREPGFTLAEMMVAIVIIGLIAGFTVPAFNRHITGWNLTTARNTVVSELKLLRQKAITEGRQRRMWFSPGSALYWTQNPDNFQWTMYRLPDRVIFESSNFSGFFDTYMQADGRASRSGQLVLRNTAGQRDTVIVDLSGFVGRP